MHILGSLICLVLFITYVQSQTVNVAFLIPGFITDNGWNYQINQGINAVKTEFGSAINVVYVEGVTADNCEQKATEFVQNGAQLIFYPSGVLATCANDMAGLYPGVSMVLQNSGAPFPNRPNLAYDVKSGVFEARFISGALSSLQKHVTKVCFMIPIFHPSLKRWSNAILLGMRYINAKADLFVGLTSDYDHPVSEGVVAQHFTNMGCDVIIQQQNSINPQLLAAQQNTWGIGWGSDMRQFVGETVLTSVVSDWSVVFGHYIDKKIHDEFISEIFTETLWNGALYMAPFSDEVIKGDQMRAALIQRKLKEGKINPFCGDPVQEKYGTKCTTEANLIADWLPGIEQNLFDGTV